MTAKQTFLDDAPKTDPASDDRLGFAPFSQQTWDREKRPRVLVDEATRGGWRLVVVRGDGSTWFPDADPNPAKW